MATLFSEKQFDIIRFCAIECKLQMSGEQSVYWMISAWDWALRRRHEPLSQKKILTLGLMIEPRKNHRGYRECNVTVGGNPKMDWPLVPQAMSTYIAHGLDALTPAEAYREFEEIHPFVDGNGRTGQIVFNWLSGTLDRPEWAPDFWGDSRRTPGLGAARLQAAPVSNETDQPEPSSEET